MPRQTGHKPEAHEDKQDFEEERRALRELIGSFRRTPESTDEGGFYRNVGRLISRSLMQPYSPGAKGR